MRPETSLGPTNPSGLLGVSVATTLCHPEIPFESTGITYPFVRAHPRSPKNVEIRSSGIEVGCIVIPVIVGRGRNLHFETDIWCISEDLVHCDPILVSGAFEGVGVGLEKLIFGATGTARIYELVESAGTVLVEI